MRTSSATLAEHVADLLWSLWGELGISSTVARRHGDVFIDPEALILFTAVESELDPRLRDESIDWVIRYGTFVSKARLKNLRAEWDVASDRPFARYAATVNEHTSLDWEGGGRSLPFRSRARSLLEDLSRPPLIALRARAVFGVSARAELFRAFLAKPTFASAAELSGDTNYGKRNVLNALDPLRFAGIVESIRVGNADQFRLVRREQIVALIGPAPDMFPPWNRQLAAILRLLRLVRRGARRSELENGIAARKFAASEADAFRQAGLYIPALPTGVEAWDALTDWATRTVAGIARVAG